MFYVCVLTLYGKICVLVHVAAIAIVRRTSVRAGVLSRNVDNVKAEIIYRHFWSGNTLCPSVPRYG